MPIRAVVYVSQAGPEVAGEPSGIVSTKLGELVDDAARFNRDAGVTGVLLFDGARFLQYLEGPEDGLGVAYSRVLGASSHMEIMELQRGRVGGRRFPFWPMRWLPLLPNELTAIALSDWTHFDQRGLAEGINPTAMDRLMSLVQIHINVAYAPGIS